MNTWPAHVEPMDRAILDLLESIPPMWRDHNSRQLSSTQQQALHLMIDAGLVERRQSSEFRMLGQAEVVETIAVVSGEGAITALMGHLFRMLPHWLDPANRLRGSLDARHRHLEIRLSDLGELARHHYQNQTVENPSTVCSFVRKTGFFATRLPVQAKLRVETFRVQSARQADHSPNQQAPSVITMAQAKTGDITIHNHNHNVVKVDLSSMVEPMVREFDKRWPPTAGPQNVPAETDGSARGSPIPVAKTRTLSDAAARAGESLEWVRRECPDLIPNAGETPGQRTPRYTPAQHEHIREYECPAYPRDQNGRSTVPPLESWTRYVREYLLFKDGPTNSPRGGRTGRSMVSPDQVERRQDDV